jgi:hypothetical protein
LVGSTLCLTLPRCATKPPTSVYSSPDFPGKSFLAASFSAGEIIT